MLMRWATVALAGLVLSACASDGCPPGQRKASRIVGYETFADDGGATIVANICVPKRPGPAPNEKRPR